MTRAVHLPYTVEQDEDGVWCAHAQLRPGVGAHGEGDSREAAIAGAIARFPGEQWGWWGLGSDLEQRLRVILESRFDELFAASPEGFIPRYITPGHEILITWQPLAQS